MTEALALTFLSETTLFADLPAARLRALAAQCHFRTVARGEVLFQQGDPSADFYILAEGSAVLSILSREGQELIVRLARSGDCFGEVALLDGLPRTATCTIREPGRVMTLPRSVFLSLLDDPQIAQRIIVTICRMLRKADHRSELLAHRPLSARVADALIANARPGDPPRLHLTQQELAHLCGATRPRVNRILKALEADGAIRKARRETLLTDLPALEAIAATERRG